MRSPGRCSRDLAVVHEDDPHLAAVVAVDDAGERVDAVAHGEPAARPHEARRGRAGSRGARRWPPPARRAGGERDVFGRAQVGAGGAARGVGGQLRAVAFTRISRRHGAGLCADAPVAAARYPGSGCYHRAVSRTSSAWSRAALGRARDRAGRARVPRAAALPLALPASACAIVGGHDRPAASRCATALAERFDLRWPEVAERALSYDGTVKYLFRLDDGATIESVYIPEDEAPHDLHLDPGRLPAASARSA